MRSLRRPAVRPPTLATGKGARQAQKLAAAGGPKGKADGKFPDYWNEADVRGPLFAMHGRTCAYCDRDLPGNDRGDVEHFRPKSRYWWLAYDFGNYYLACNPCNRQYKKDAFPLRPGATPVAYARRAALAREGRLLIDPASDPVEEWLDVRVEEPRCRVVPGPKARRDRVGAVRSRETIEFFHFNCDIALVQDRFNAVNQALDDAHAAVAGDVRARERARRAASRYSRHAPAIRALFARNSPQLLPSAVEEVQWLVEGYLKELDLCDAILRESPGSKGAAAMRAENVWCLAALYKCPPAGTAAQVLGWIGAPGLRQEVAARAARL